MERYDAIIIGSGQGGVPLAKTLSEEGRSVLILEREAFGGSCVNFGCTPSKAFLGAAHAAGRAREAHSLGVYCDVQVDFGRIMDRIRKLRFESSHGVYEGLRRSGVEIVHAEGHLTREGHVATHAAEYTAPLIVIDTGTSPKTPSLPGLDRISPLTDRNFWDLVDLPPRVTIVGAGYVGLELGQGLRRLGAEVSIVETGDQVLSNEDRDVSALLQEALEEDGVRFYLRTEIERIERRSDGEIQLFANTGTRESSLVRSDALLLATGREPNTRSLLLDEAGIEADEAGYIRINSRFETSRPGVYAIGEVAGQPAFTHVAWEDHRRLLDILGGGERHRDDRTLAYAIFTEPQVARAGLTLRQAESQGLQAREVKIDLKEIARSREWGQTLGFYRLTVEDRTQRILGATLVGYETAELIHCIVDLMEAGGTWRQLERAVHIHPTYAEGLPTLARKLIN